MISSLRSWVAAQTIDKFVARLDQGMALTQRRDVSFSIVGASNAAHERL
jgi:hypothetical protein